MTDKNFLDELSDIQQKVKPNWLTRGYTHPELQNADLPDPEWLVDTLIPNPGLVAITGRPGHFKTFFTQWMALRLSAQLPLFDHWDSEPNYDPNFTPKEPIGVVFIEEEMNARQIKKRSTDMKSWKNNNFHWFISAGFSLKDGGKVAELRYFIEKNNIKLLILDPFSTCSGMKDENDNSEASKVMDTIRHEFVDTKHGCTVIFIHHPAKGEGSSENIRGAGDILGKCDMHFVVEKVGEEPTKTIKIKCKKTRFEQPEDFFAEMVVDGNDLGRLEWQYRGSAKAQYVKDRDELTDKILTSMELGEKYTQKEVAEMVGQRQDNRRFRNVWTQIIEEKSIKKNGRYSWERSLK